MSRPLIVIPARLASTRLPNKPLALLGGKPMIVHVWQCAVEADIGDVIVACCGPEIADVVKNAGGNAVITDPSHPSGTDRIKEALQDRLISDDTIIVNLQGDLPTISKAALRAVLAPLENSAVDIGTLAAPMTALDQIENPNIVKVAIAFETPDMGRALYFSRAPIPYGSGTFYHHIGIYAYRGSAFKRYVSLKPSPLEKTESLEQLRALEDGMRIDVKMISEAPHTVDTQKDLDSVIRFLGSKQ